MRSTKLLLVSLLLVGLSACSGTQETISSNEETFLSNLAQQSQVVPEVIVDSTDVPADVKTVLKEVQTHSDKWASEAEAQLKELGAKISTEEGAGEIAKNAEKALQQAAKNNTVEQTRAWITSTVNQREALLKEAKDRLADSDNSEIVKTAEQFIEDQQPIVDELKKALDSL